MIPRSSLRTELVSAVTARRRALQNGWSRRKDIPALWASISRAERFLESYPYADDERVRAWISGHVDDVCRIVPGNAHRQLARLVMEHLGEAVTVTAQGARQTQLAINAQEA